MRWELLQTETIAAITQVINVVLTRNATNEGTTYNEAEDAQYEEAVNEETSKYYEDADERIRIGNVLRETRSGVRCFTYKIVKECGMQDYVAEVKQAYLFND